MAQVIKRVKRPIKKMVMVCNTQFFALKAFVTRERASPKPVCGRI